MKQITETILEEIKKNHIPVVIYGAGRNARLAAERLRYEDYRVKCHVVASLDSNPFYICGKPVVEIEELEKDDCVIFVCVREALQGEIETVLKKYDLNCIYGMSDEFYERWDKEIKEIEQRDEKIHSLRSYIDPYEKTLCDIAHERGLSAKKARTYVKDGLMRLNDGKVHMARLVVVLGTKCSLRCKECNNLMPHFKPQKDLDRSVILNSLETLTAQTGSILKCELIGGEPFLSNNLKELLEYAICNPSIDSVEITTNGTVIPTEDVIPLLKKPKVLVRISDYGELVNQKSMISFLEKHKIRYISLKMESWISPGGVEKRNRDENTLQNYYQRCSSGYYCKTLYGDKLFACARAASLFALGYMKEPEFIVLNDGFQAAQLKEFMLRRLSMACDYCDMTIDNRRLVCAAEQLK